jgi:hypothetical protein
MWRRNSFRKTVSKLPKHFGLDKREIYILLITKKLAIKATVPRQQNPPLISVSLNLCLNLIKLLLLLLNYPYNALHQTIEGIKNDQVSELHMSLITKGAF